jgi:hypothetical protein
MVHSAFASIDKNQRYALVDHTEGFAAYKLTSGGRVATYVTGDKPSGLPKSVTFGEDERVVAVGGEYGKVFMFDKQGGRPIGVLPHSASGRVQHIAVRLCSRHKLCTSECCVCAGPEDR